LSTSLCTQVLHQCPDPAPRTTASLRYTINHPPTTTKDHATKVFCDIDHTTVARIAQVRRRRCDRDADFSHQFKRGTPAISPMRRSGALCRPCDRPRNIFSHLPGGRGAATRGSEARADLSGYPATKGRPLSSPPGETLTQ